MKVGVIGLGYVGLPLLVELARSGFTALGIDVDSRKVESVNRGESYINDITTEELTPLVQSGKIRATTDWDALSDLDAISICVPTPLRKTKDPDISYIVATAQEIAPRLRRGQLIILESTTYPGTTEELLQPDFEKNGLVAGEDFFLAFSPERVDPGNARFNTKNTPKIVGGCTPACGKRAVEYYEQVFDTVVSVSSARCAEMVKLLENTFRSVNIGLVNEMAVMCNKLDLNVWEVIDAAATKPFGFMPFYPGPGLGGHCIPIDPHYLSWKLKALNYTARFIELASDVNSHMPEFVVDKIVRALNDDRKAVNGSRILVLGVAYKANVSDVRESPALDIIGLLQNLNSNVEYHDPHVAILEDHGLSMKSVPLAVAQVENADCVVIATRHSDMDLAMVGEKAKLIIDCRNAMKAIPVKGRLVNL